MTASPSDARVLMVDDEATNISLLDKILRREGYANLWGFQDARAALDAFPEVDPDIVLLDLHMPHLDGFQVMEALVERLSAGSFLPILVLTADVMTETKQRALSAGATDFLTKPFDRVEVLLRMRNLLRTRAMHLELRDQNVILEEKVREQTAELWDAIRRLEGAEKELRLSREETIHRLSIAAEFRDDETARHIHRMSRYCELLARRMGMDPERSELIRVAAQMHDVGKIGMPDGVLLKPGRLSSSEFEMMRRHAEIGYRILQGARSELGTLAADIAWTHHEKFDGSGYPRRLKAQDIPLEGRLAAVADVFDALTTDRIYRSALELPEAVRIMREGRGIHFDPQALDAFVDAMDEVLATKERFDEPKGRATKPGARRARARTAARRSEAV